MPAGPQKVTGQSILRVVGWTRMPLYRYIPAKAPCKLCGDGFEHRQSAGDSDLTRCPTCGQTVSRTMPQPVNTPKITAPLSISSAKQAGFTVLRRTCNGDFEKQ